MVVILPKIMEICSKNPDSVCKNQFKWASDPIIWLISTVRNKWGADPIIYLGPAAGLDRSFGA